jgi:microcystin-dependent protein
MADLISVTKGITGITPAFDTYVPELEENADIQNALELFYYGNSEDGNTIDPTNSIYSNLVSFDARITANDGDITGHTGAISDVHGVGAGNSIVGTGTTQTLTNKTLTSPKINENVVLTATSTELNYVDGVTSPIQTQINTNTPTGMISIHAGSSAPTGWLLCDGMSYASASYTALFSVIGQTFGGTGTDFAVPNLKGKVVVGIDASQASFDTRGETGGAMTHQHASSNTGNTSVAHNHTIPSLSTNTMTSAGDHGHNLTAHSHYSDHSHYADHSHSINPGETATSSDSHSHITNTNNANASRATGTSSVSLASHTHNTYSDSHAHNVNIATFTSANANGSGVTTGNSNYGNTAGANANTTASNSGNHNHSVSTVSSATTDGAGGTHGHTISASDTLSNLQPYIALNYIIKI